MGKGCKGSVPSKEAWPNQSLGKSFMLRAIRVTEGLGQRSEASRLAVGNDPCTPAEWKTVEGELSPEQ